MADTSFTAKITTVLAAWLNVINNFVYKGRSPNYVTSTGSANAQVITLPSGTLYSAYVAGDEFTFKVGVANTAAMTLQVIGSATLAATAVKRLDGSALIEGDLPLGAIVTIVHDGTNLLLKNVYINVSAFGKTLIDDAAASDARTTLGLGTAATVADSTLVHLAGAETITGTKTLSSAALNEARSNVAQHATTMDFWAAAVGNVLDGTGSALTITAIANAPQAGASRDFYPIVATVLTHGATFDIDGAVNRTAAAGEVWTFVAKSVSTYRVFVRKADGTAVVESSAAGQVIQVVSTTKTDTFSTATTGSWVAVTGLSQAITPASTLNKVLVKVILTHDFNAALGSAGYARLTRGGVAIGVGDAAGSRTQASFQLHSGPSASECYSEMFEFYDSPASVSAQTYAVEVFISAVTLYIGRTANDTDNSSHGRFPSSIMCMEVKG